jgi:tetratricopeptide (TPR) repeat protein
MLVVEPGVERQAVATEAPATVLVLGGRPGAAMPPSPFEYWYSAVPASEAGDHDRAYEIVAEGLEHHPDHGTIHYVLGCERALAGRADEAIEHLRIAFERDPRTRGWAEDDEELESLRGDPRFEDLRG